MKSHICFKLLCLLITLLSLLLTSCNAEPFNVSVSSDFEKKSEYIVQTPLYQIYEEGLQEYRYKIGTSQKVFAEGVKHGTEPAIDEIDNGIIRLFMGFGTNAFSVQYFDIWRDRTSEKFSPYTIYADFSDPKTEECLIAYFEGPSPPGECFLLVKDVFDNQGFETKIDCGFISATCNRIIFLNENEMYLDYDVFADGYSYDDVIANNPVEYKNIREVVQFRKDTEDGSVS